MKSIEHIENLLDEQFVNGIPIEGGLFAQELGGKVFSLASYIGEVLINTEGTDWEFDPHDPDNDFNMMIASKTGASIFEEYNKRWPDILELSKSFELLLQIDCNDSNTDLSKFGGSGAFYFCIDRVELGNHNFDDVKMIYQTTKSSEKEK